MGSVNTLSPPACTRLLAWPIQVMDGPLNGVLLSEWMAAKSGVWVRLGWVHRVVWVSPPLACRAANESVG